MTSYSWKYTPTLLVSICYMIIPQISNATTDLINTTRTLRDGEALVSSSGRFELRFFSPRNDPTNRYVGLCYKNLDDTFVWVANRDTPLTNTRGVLKVIGPGLLVLLNETQHIIWTTNTSRPARNPVAQLLDTGNIVVRESNDESPENFLWQSFDYPSDTYLPGMNFGQNLVTGLKTYLSCWRGEDDPSPGRMTWTLDPTGYPQVFLKNGTSPLYRVGPWNGFRFCGEPIRSDDLPFKMVFVMDAHEVRYRRLDMDRSVIARLVVRSDGYVRRYTWVDQAGGWVGDLNMPGDLCDTYRLCGVNGVCMVGNTPPCRCLDGFDPADPQGWVRADWTGGCVRRGNLSCGGGGDFFRRYPAVKLPDALNSTYNASTTLGECKKECLKNCSCTAYAQLDIRKGTGCLMWYEDLVDVRSLSPNGQDIYIRMAPSESVSKDNSRKTLVVSLAIVGGVILAGLSILIYCSRKRKNEGLVTKDQGKLQGNNQENGPDLPQFPLSVILNATNNFSNVHKIGEGGFGPVYKGVLEGGQEIAVKRLSKESTQGTDEFTNEVIFIAKLQHRNLVRLLGCCIQGEENMLVYEYMQNNSLSSILFDESKGKLLDWESRFNIIDGIARGLMYLHQDSRLRIIHRDLKASNILLDSDMNPKISDFGTAKTFRGNETEAKTRRVVGTYGYMSPEYVVDGLFSVKSDVFSFGVLLLEIVSGKKNRGYFHSDHSLNLLGHAWTLYKEGRELELVDASLRDTKTCLPEVVRSIHVGLLCVQKNPEDRPIMSSVILMLGNESMLIAHPKQPGFFTDRDVIADSNSMSSHAANSINELTVTMPEPR